MSEAIEKIELVLQKLHSWKSWLAEGYDLPTWQLVAWMVTELEEALKELKR